MEVLEESGNAYYYSTKTGEQDVTLHHGERIDGAMDGEATRAFCQEHGIRLLVDAAHPFASQLHQTIAEVACRLTIPAIRFERIFPERDSSLTWLDDYSQIPHDIHTLLATTGVQSIHKLKPLERLGMKVVYRILPRESSIALAKQQGATDDQLCYYEDGSTIEVEADAILLKESGLSGGFQEKVDAAKARGMRILVIKRPETPAVFYCVNGPYGLRRAVEKMLPEFYPLHSGLTTGTCATAAAIAATLQLVQRENITSLTSHLLPLTSEVSPLTSEVSVILPNGETIHVPVSYGDGYASVFKEAGDDPDVTNGLEIRASVEHSEVFEILGGEGVGRFTLPGFDFPPGSPAINKAPREMIIHNLQTILSPLTSHPSPLTSHPLPLTVTISVPQGAEIARRTFNPRLGIEGGISIIGVSGIVKPFSEEAFIDSIRKCMQVAKASETDRVVINSGGKSERFVKALYPGLPQQAFVEYGNYIGETLKMADELGFRQVTLGVMLGKAVKLAAGHLDTHSRRAVMDKDFIAQMLVEAGISIDISNITLARELWEMIPTDQLPVFSRTIIRHCADYCRPLLPDGTLEILLIDDNGRIFTEDTKGSGTFVSKP